MANDPVSLSDTLASLPNEADYEAAYAAIMATERGRWFLAKHSDRKNAADTQTLLAAIARVEAAIRGEPAPQLPAVLHGDLVDLAAVVVHIEAQIAISRTPAAHAPAAVERIQDIAFALRERDAEAALCAELEAAIRDIGEALARDEAVAQRLQRAASLLRDLKGRINAMIALAGGKEPAAADANAPSAAPVAIEGRVAGGDAADAEIPASAAPSEKETQEDEDFAQAVAALSASFSAPDDAAAPLGESAEAAHRIPSASLSRTGPEEDPGDLFEPLPPGPIVAAEARGPTAATGALSDDVQTFLHVGPTDPDAKSSRGSLADRAWLPSLEERTPLAVSASVIEAARRVLAPETSESASAAPSSEQLGSQPTAARQPPEEPRPLAAAAPIVQATAPSGASDPLASLRALSEEELIALFS